MLTLRAESYGTDHWGPSYPKLAQLGGVSLERIIAWMGGRLLPPEAIERMEKELEIC